MQPTILLVEDDAADVVLLKRAIKKLNFDVQLLHLEDGDDTVNYLRGAAPYNDRTTYPLPSLILMDIKLPRRDGFEVVLWLRQQETPLNRIAVVMLTSSGQRVDVNRAYEVGANSYLRKPDKPAELAALLTAFKDYWLIQSELPEISPSGGHGQRKN